MAQPDQRPVLETGEVWKPYPAASSPALLDSMGRHRTGGLFLEQTQDSVLEPWFTMRSHSYKGLPSAYEVFMGSVDETDAAMKLVGSLAHWRKLMKCKWFLNGGQAFEGLYQWRIDMVARDLTRSKTIYEEGMRKGDLNSAKAMLALIEKSDKLYKSMTEGVTPRTSEGSPPPPRGKGRRGNQQPPGSVVDFGAEMARLRGEENA